MIRAYLAGPMSGHENHNFPAFVEFTKKWREKGFVVISPMEMSGLPEHGSQTWADHMRRDVRLELECDVLVLMSGWESSNGARWEVYNALNLSMPIYDSVSGNVLDNFDTRKRWLAGEMAEVKKTALLKESVNTLTTWVNK